MIGAWVWLIVAGLLEVGWAVGLKFTDGFTKLCPTIATVAVMVLSFICLSQAAERIPIGTAYAVWAGIGAVGTMMVSMTMLGEPVSLLKVACLGLIVVGIVGLKMLQ